MATTVLLRAGEEQGGPHPTRNFSQPVLAHEPAVLPMGMVGSPALWGNSSRGEGLSPSMAASSWELQVHPGSSLLGTVDSPPALGDSHTTCMGPAPLETASIQMGNSISPH